MIQALGVFREAEFSPGKVEADAAILDAALAELGTLGVSVETVEASGLISIQPGEWDLVFAMCQGETALSRLADLERGGAIVINSTRAIRACYRDQLGLILARAQVTSPRSVLIDCANPMARAVRTFDFGPGVFVKRGDLHALSADDVVRVGSHTELREALTSFHGRGIRQALVQQAVEGVVVKFYGVGEDGFFAAFEPEESGRLDGVPAALHRTASRAAAALGLEVWGGDAIVAGSRVWIVDFNDWPSFARVREGAAQAIARRALSLLQLSGRMRTDSSV